MILLIFAATGLALGLVTGGSIRCLARYPLKGVLLPIAALLLKAAASMFLKPQTGAVAVSLIQYALIFIFLFLNRKRPLWPLFVWIGSLLNLLVIALNGGCMPVAASLLGNATQRLEQLGGGQIYAYCLMDETTRLPFLGDVIRVGPAGVPIGFASVGDVVLCVGVALLLFMMTRPGGRLRKANEKTGTTEGAEKER